MILNGIKNQGKIYKTNPNLNYMDHTLRTFFLLNHFGVKCSEEEWLGIQLTDGLYDENNKNIISHIIKTKHLKHHYLTSLHQADINAARYEYERWQNEMSPVKSTRNPNGRPSSKENYQIHLILLKLQLKTQKYLTHLKI